MSGQMICKQANGLAILSQQSKMLVTEKNCVQAQMWQVQQVKEKPGSQPVMNIYRQFVPTQEIVLSVWLSDPSSSF